MAINCHDCAHNLGGRCEYFGHPIGMHECPHGEKRKPRNNYEKIMQMDPEEFAEWMVGASKWVHGYSADDEKWWWFMYLGREVKEPGP